jgi:hypothetical protein
LNIHSGFVYPPEVGSPPLPAITPSMVGATPSPPPKSVRNSAPARARRDFTLPRTPSESRSTSTRTPSPPPVRRRHVRRTERHPQAMHFADVISRKNPIERAVGYADKINELYNLDCGLAGWLVDVRTRGRFPSFVF